MFPHTAAALRPNVIQPDCYQVSDMLFSHGNKLSIEEGSRAELSMRVDQ